MKAQDGTNLSKALANYEKQFQSLPYHELPHDIVIFDKQTLDLSAWTLIVTDKCLKRISTNPCNDGDNNSIRVLNLSGGSKITDVGIKAISNSLYDAENVLLENVFRITDKGLTEVIKRCRNIKKLSLSGCLGISGNGFAILGQYSLHLSSLKLSGCRQISTWSFMKIFEGCNQLNELDISYCSLITDQEINVLASRCEMLQRVNFKECCQLSDVGILSLVQRCTHLLSINLSRSDLVVRITDVALMAIGESCKHLLSINLAGCSKVSDTGISWLTAGCPLLIYLNLSGCNAITNGGMKYIGEACIELKTLILINAQKISDVGLRYLADGCVKLENLNVSGLFKISDGVQRDFALEGIQSIGSSKCAITLKKFNLNGCFQISHLALKAFATMTNLEHLVLSGCTKLTLAGLKVIAISCREISYLSLASCGDCITNEIIEVMTDYLHSLQTLILSDCSKISRRALKGISRCKNITHLNLSGCKRVNNEAILALCDGIYQEGIKELFIDRCPCVDDNALVWVVDSLSSKTNRSNSTLSLTTLSMKGTKITVTSAKTLSERFKYSSLKINSSFFGFWPLSRTNDRIGIDNYYISTESATRIQATLRGLKGRSMAAEKREELNMIKKVNLVTALWRGRATRIRLKHQRHEIWMKRTAAIKLQCLCRCFLARKSSQIIREKRWKVVAPYAATRIQKIFRGVKAREIARNAKTKQIQLIQKQISNSIKLQAFFRCRLAINLKKKMKMDRIELESKQLSCCIKIQSTVRMKIAMLEIIQRQREYQQKKQEVFNAALLITFSLKAYRFRSLLNKRVQHKAKLNIMAKRIQIWYVDLVKEISEKLEKQLKGERQRELSAIVIEKTWRRKAAFIMVKKLRQEKKCFEELKCKKSLLLTSWFRMCLAKKRLKTLRNDHMEYMKLCAIVETEAATQIAAYWRGHKGRLKARIALDLKKTRWKKMWSNEDNRYFFYNQITGESRWRMPQDLLDLEPKPICNNCEYFEAIVECSSCNEYFCGTCWDAVHFGGQRKLHKFRSLYDYYGKRVDYGDTEFPSIWPSDIEQDERFGWQIRDER